MTIESLWVLNATRRAGECYWNLVKVRAVEKGAHDRRYGHG